MNLCGISCGESPLLCSVGESPAEMQELMHNMGGGGATRQYDDHAPKAQQVRDPDDAMFSDVDQRGLPASDAPFGASDGDPHRFDKHSKNYSEYYKQPSG